jgi:protein-S-isoprenylcysteine O-methyltransferase Ste14
MQTLSWKSPLVVFARSLFWTIVFPGTVAGYIPWRFFGFRMTGVSGLAAIAGLVLFSFGICLLLLSIVEFARRGKGTLSPIDPPDQLVVTGAYRWVRNPMYVGVMSVLVGEALISSELSLAVYAGAFFVLANLFIIGYEEPTLERLFGASYVEYKRKVRRWVPRTSPWEGQGKPASGTHDLTNV